jgi:phosphoribosylformimino-5-aminoimidazole carboxamide ribotide isomerase
VKQIVGGTLSDSAQAGLVTNFESDRPPAYYAQLYRKDGLFGGHVIMLGPGNTDAALEALRAFPGGLQVGGGITPSTAGQFLDAGASHVIVTSYVFRDGRLEWERLRELVAVVGKERLVLDLSCRRKGSDYFIVTDRWQKFTQHRVDEQCLALLAGHCAEFLVHAVDVEGKMAGIDRTLIELLARHSPIAATYAGGVSSLEDLDTIANCGKRRVDVTVGSALDIFGGQLKYEDVVARCGRYA